MQSLVPGVFLLPCIWKKLPVAGSGGAGILSETTEKHIYYINVLFSSFGTLLKTVHD